MTTQNPLLHTPDRPLPKHVAIIGNALAERMNGILKSEYGLDQCFKTTGQTTQAVNQAIHLYGTRRPHTALGNRFPARVHESFLPPAPPCGMPGEWDPGARPEPRTEVRSPGSGRRYPTRRPFRRAASREVKMGHFR